MGLIIEIPAHLSHSQSSNLTGEYWVPAPGLEGYEVSSRGRVRSWRNRRGFPASEPHEVGRPNKRGHIEFRPHRRGPQVGVHRLVCRAFNGPAPFEGALVRHLNDDPKDNRPENLAWGTPADNARDRSRNGNSRSPRPRLSMEQVRRLRAERIAGATYGQLASKYDIHPETVGLIVRGVTRKDV